MIDKWLYTFFGWLDIVSDFVEKLIFNNKKK